MKACIVKLSTVAKHRHLEASYYIGMIAHKDIDEQLAIAQKRLNTAKKRIKTLKQEKVVVERRVAAMVARGEIQIVPSEVSLTGGIYD